MLPYLRTMLSHELFTQLDRRVEFSNLVQPICLPSPSTPPFQEPGAPSPASVGNNRARSSVEGGEDLNEIKQEFRCGCTLHMY